MDPSKVWWPLQKPFCWHCAHSGSTCRRFEVHYYTLMLNYDVAAIYKCEPLWNLTLGPLEPPPKCIFLFTYIFSWRPRPQSWLCGNTTFMSWFLSWGSCSKILKVLKFIILGPQTCGWWKFKGSLSADALAAVHLGQSWSGATCAVWPAVLSCVLCHEVRHILLGIRWCYILCWCHVGTVSLLHSHWHWRSWRANWFSIPNTQLSFHKRWRST